MGILLGACGSDAGSNNPGAPEDAESPLVLYQATGSGGDGALLVGTLTRRDGCLYAEHGDGSLTLLLFPSPGTVWDEEGNYVSYDGETTRLNQEMSLSGGEAAPGFFETIEWVNPPGAGCRTADTFVVRTP